MRWTPSALSAFTAITATPIHFPRDTLLINIASLTDPMENLIHSTSSTHLTEGHGIFYDGSTLSILAQKELEAEKTAQLQQYRGTLNDAGLLFITSTIIASSRSAYLPMLAGWGIFSSARELLFKYSSQEKVTSLTTLNSLTSFTPLLSVYTFLIEDTHTHFHPFLTCLSFPTIGDSSSGDDGCRGNYVVRQIHQSNNGFAARRRCGNATPT